MEKFRIALNDLKLHAVVHDYLDQDQASSIGHQLRVSEKHTTVRLIVKHCLVSLPTLFILEDFSYLAMFFFVD